MASQKVIIQKVGGLALSLILVVLLSQSSEARRVDCTKFVFAPICRGVSAKRGLTPLFTSEEDRGAGPDDRLSNMAALDDDSEFPRGAEREGQDDLGSRRLPSNGGKTGGRDAAIHDPIHDYLRMRMAELQDDLMQARDSGSDGVLRDPFSADNLKSRFQKAYRHARESGQF